MAGSMLVMNLVGFFAGALPFLSVLVSPYMHWSSSTMKTPFMLISFCTSGSDQLEAPLGCSKRNHRPARCCLAQTSIPTRRSSNPYSRSSAGTPPRRRCRSVLKVVHGGEAIIKEEGLLAIKLHSRCCSLLFDKSHFLLVMSSTYSKSML